MRAKLLLSIALLLGLIVAGCAGAEDAPQGLSPLPPSAQDMTPPPPPPLAIKLLEMNLTPEEVTAVIAELSPTTPGYREGHPGGWYVPSAEPSSNSPMVPTPEPQVISFAMPERYEKAGLLGLAFRRSRLPQGAVPSLDRPDLIDLGIAEYESSEGGQEALSLGARIYGFFPLGTQLYPSARESGVVVKTSELAGLGDGAIVDLTDYAAAVSVRVDCNIGTVIVPYSWQDGTDMPSTAEPLGAALAEKLAAAP